MKDRLIFGSGKVPGIINNEQTTILSKSQCDVTSVDIVRKAIHAHRPKVVINCAAKTNLENCEENKYASYNVNTQGPINILKICAEMKVKFIHISSGCLFDGNHFVSTEESPPDPKVWYTWTKTWADQFITNYGYENFLILRPRQLISAKSHPSNMLTKFASMDVISAIKEQNSITCIEDFSNMITHLIDKDARGIYNCCNDETLSPYDIASKIKKTINPNLVIKETDYESLLKMIPNKRVNTILSNEKLKSTGYEARTASDALDWCLKNYR